MKKIFLVFVLAILTSCTNVPQNSIFENASQNEVEKSISQNTTSEKIENEKYEEKTENKEFDLNYEYEKYIENTIAEIAQLPENERIKKVGNFEFVIERKYVSVKYFDEEVTDISYDFLKPSGLNWELFSLQVENDPSSFQKCLEQDCKVTKERIFEEFTPEEMGDEFEVIEKNPYEYDYLGYYIFDKKNKKYLGEVDYVKEIFRKGDRVFVYSANPWDYKSLTIFGEFNKMYIRESFDFEKSIFSEKGVELKNSQGETILKYNFSIIIKG